MSKKGLINPSDGLDIDGWYVGIYTEKNKLAPSQHWVTCVFDKNKGLDKFWSEYTFLSDPTPGEAKIYKDKKLPYPLMIQKVGNKYCLKVIDPATSNVMFESQPIWRKNFKAVYIEDANFKQWFDYAVYISIQQRIVNGLFKLEAPPHVAEEEIVISSINEEVETETILPIVPISDEMMVNSEII